MNLSRFLKKMIKFIFIANISSTFRSRKADEKKNMMRALKRREAHKKCELLNLLSSYNEVLLND